MMNASTTVTRNAVRRSKLVETHNGTAASGIQNSGNAVNSSSALATMARSPMLTITPICTRSSRSRLWPNFRR